MRTQKLLPYFSALLLFLCLFIPQLVFIALIPFFVWLFKKPTKVWGPAFASGLIFYLGYLHWVFVIHHWSNYLLAGLSWILLSAYQALFWGVMALLTKKMIKDTSNHFHQLILLSFSAGLISASKSYLGPAALPIAPLTNFLSNQPYLLQGLSFWHVPGMEILIFGVNIWLAQLIFYKKVSLPFKYIPLAFFISYFIFSVSVFYFVPLEKSMKTIRIGVVQPGVPQALKMNEAHFTEQENDLFELSLAFNPKAIDYILWPETVIPRLLVQDPLFLEKTKKLKAPLLTGTPYYENNQLYNGLAYIQNGRVLQIARKYHLVPFGEYLPFRKILGFIAKDSGLEWDYAPGPKNQLLYLNHGKIAPLICFESLFGQEVRHKIKAGGQAILLITNDAWFKETAGMSQHAQYLIIRAIENRRFALSLGNTGPSYLVNPKGQIIQQLAPYTRSSAVFTLPLSSQ
jgi:apolipoprotein N-acyltransferase